MFKRIIEDINVVFERDPAARSVVEVISCYPGLKAICCHRVSHFLWRIGLRFFARLLSQISRFLTATEIGDDVTLYQGVVLGGVSLAKKKRHPTIGNEVVIGAGAIVLGPIKIGDGSRVGANSVVLKDVKPYTTVVGTPAREAGRHLIKDHHVDLDHSKIIDPIKKVIDQLKAKIKKLEDEIESLKKKTDET